MGLKSRLNSKRLNLNIISDLARRMVVRLAIRVFEWV